MEWLQMGKETLIEKSNEWWQKKLDEGWIDTPLGILPPEEIKKSGMIYEDGIFKIPSTYKISNGTDGHKKGEKYVCNTKQFTDWYLKRVANTPEEIIDTSANELEEFFNQDIKY